MVINMSRKPREISETGHYHIVFKGISRQNIFEENEDFEKLIDLLKNAKITKNFELLAYCLMTNHVHLFLKEENAGDISLIMRSILGNYAQWFNLKYQRIGPLFADRFKSEKVEDLSYLCALVRYIHKNPVYSGLVGSPSSYIWSSYSEYTKDKKNNLVNAKPVLDCFSNDKKTAIEMFKEFHANDDREIFEISDGRKKSTDYIRKRIKKIIDGAEPHTIKTMDIEERNKILSILKAEEKFSIREIERATGISRGIIGRA